MPLLVSGMVDEVPSVRVVAATYLGIIHEQPAESVPPLISALEDRTLEVRRAAATALGSVRGQEAEAAFPHCGRPLATSTRTSHGGRTLAYQLQSSWR